MPTQKHDPPATLKRSPATSQRTDGGTRDGAHSVLIERVLDRRPCATLHDYVDRGGGEGLRAARDLGPKGIIDEIDAAGLRGRGGAGFPTGVKWRTIASASVPRTAPVVVNAAEGEPATFKDRELMRVNPFKILEGALIAATAMDAAVVVIATKATFGPELARMSEAIAAIRRAGWAPGVEVRVVEGPSEYLFGEETGLLEVLDGRQPFPRIAPPYLRGIAESRAGDDAPVLVDNVETLANVPGIVANGAQWYRSVGTDESPGTLICTMTGHCQRHAVGEVPMGTPLREAIERIGGGAIEGRRIVAALSGVANAIVPEHLLDTPLSYEAMSGIGSGLGAGGFYVCDDQTDIAALTLGASRFLAVESCGQCEPCKRDGLAIAARLDALCRGEATQEQLDELPGLLDTVTDGARCFLATQQQRVVSAALQHFPAAFQGHVDGSIAPVAIEPIVPLGDIVGGRAELEVSHLTKQPDWTYDDVDSGKWPAAALGDEPVEIEASASPQLAPDATDAIATGREAAADPLQPLLDLNADVRRAVDQAVNAAGREQAPAMEELRARLSLHDDVTQRVVHPMAARVAGSPADDAGWRAEREHEAANRLLDILETRDTTGPASADALTAALDEVRRAVDRDEATIVELLRSKMDEQDLRELGDAVEEARLTHREDGGRR